MITSYKPTITDKVFRNIDVFAQSISSFFLKQSPRDFVSLSTIHDMNTIVMDDGSLLTAIRIDGMIKTPFLKEHATTVNSMEQRFKSYIDNGNHKFTFYFGMDNDKVLEELEHVFGRDARATATKMGLISHDFIDDQIHSLAKHCHLERSLLIVRTRIGNFSKTEKNQLKALRTKQHRDALPMRDAQTGANGVELYINRHSTLVESIVEDFRAIDIASRLMSCREYIYEVRNAVDAKFTDYHWQPMLPGDKYPLRLATEPNSDMSNFGVPTIKDQVVPRMFDILDHSVAQIGDTVYAPLTVELAPSKYKPFAVLYRSLKAEGIPFRVTFDIDGNGLALLGLRETFAALLVRTPGTESNRHIVETKKHLQHLRRSGETDVQMRMTFCTWAQKGDIAEAKRRREVLARKLQAWGGATPSEAEGDVAETLISSIPSISRGNAAEPFPSTLHDVMKSMPIFQPASIWEKGSRIYRSMTGKILPCQPVSSQQAHWTKIIAGPMGFGKSVELACDNLALLLHPDNEDLPYIRQIDIGPSSRGFIEFVRSLLPESRRHLAIYERLSNTEKHCINFMDTLLGLRYPLSNHRSTILNLLALLCIPEDKELPHDGTIDVLDRLVSLAFDRCADRKFALEYQRNVNVDIDARLKELDFVSERSIVRWWDVVDFLFLNDDYRFAQIAQRYAVPDLSTLVNLCSDPRIADEFAELTTSTGERMSKFISRKLTAAKSKYPIIGGRTAFELSGARIISLDLDDVTKGKGAEAAQRTSLMYMLAGHILTTDIYTGDEHVAEMPNKVGIYDIDYRPYHKRHIRLLQRSKKRFCADEVHRGRDVPSFISMLITMVLEGRKWLVDVTLASQLANAFPSDIVELATSIIVLGAGTNKNVETISETFGLSDSMQYHLKHTIRKPNAKGSTFIGIIETDKGTIEQIMVSTSNPEFIWAVNSVRADSYVRNELSVQIGATEARKLLVKRYPSGTIAEEVELRRKAMGQNMDSLSLRGDETFEDDVSESLLDDIVTDCVKYHNKFMFIDTIVA